MPNLIERQIYERECSSRSDCYQDWISRSSDHITSNSHSTPTGSFEAYGMWIFSKYTKRMRRGLAKLGLTKVEVVYKVRFSCWILWWLCACNLKKVRHLMCVWLDMWQMYTLKTRSISVCSWWRLILIFGNQCCSYYWGHWGHVFLV